MRRKTKRKIWKMARKSVGLNITKKQKLIDNITARRSFLPARTRTMRVSSTMSPAEMVTLWTG